MKITISNTTFFCFYVSSHSIQELTWPVIHQRYSKRYPNILALFDLICTLPASSAQCERGFSAMKKNKTDYRNKLSAESLSDVMTIQLHSAKIPDFNPLPAVHHWFKSAARPRRPGIQDDPLMAAVAAESYTQEMEIGEQSQGASVSDDLDLSDSEADSLFSEVADLTSESKPEDDFIN